jgi:hypothetical protein
MNKAFAVVLSTLIFAVILSSCVKNNEPGTNPNYSNSPSSDPNVTNYQNMIEEQDQRAMNSEAAEELDAAHGHGGGHR